MALLSSLAKCSRGMGNLLEGLQMAEQQQLGQQAVARAAAATRGRQPAVPVMQQLVTAISITTHVAAKAEGHVCLLLGCPPGGKPIFSAAAQLFYALSPLTSSFLGPWRVDQHLTTEEALELGRCAACCLRVAAPGMICSAVHVDA